MVSPIKFMNLMKKVPYLIIASLLTFLFTNVALADKVEPAIGGQLVVITTEQENEFVRRLAKDHLVWLGGTDEFKEGEWTWDNGEAFKFKHWDAKQPSAASGHNFLILNGKNGKWADTTDFSGKVKGYICEWKGTAPKDAGPKDAELKAPKGAK